MYPGRPPSTRTGGQGSRRKGCPRPCALLPRGPPLAATSQPPGTPGWMEGPRAQFAPALPREPAAAAEPQVWAAPQPPSRLGNTVSRHPSQAKPAARPAAVTRRGPGTATAEGCAGLHGRGSPRCAAVRPASDPGAGGGRKPEPRGTDSIPSPTRWPRCGAGRCTAGGPGGPPATAPPAPQGYRVPGGCIPRRGELLLLAGAGMQGGFRPRVRAPSAAWRLVEAGGGLRDPPGAAAAR